MAKFRTIVKEIEAEQWTVKSKPARVTQKHGIQELGFVDGAKGRKDCKIGDYIIAEEGGAYPMTESEFLGRYEQIGDGAAVAPTPDPNDQAPQTDQAPTTEAVDGQVQS